MRYLSHNRTPINISDTHHKSPGLLVRLTRHLPGGARALPLALPWALWCWIAFTTLGTLTALALAVLPGLARRRRLARRTSRLALAACGVRVGTAGHDGLPAGASVLVANHASYLDGVVLTAALPPTFAFVIKSEVRRVPGVHLLLRRLGSEFVERFDRRRGARDVRRLFRKAGGGSALAFFPEGTFGPEPGLAPFRRTAFATASRAGVPVVPVAILGTRQVLPAGSALPWPGRIVVVVGEALPPALPEDLVRAARQRILVHLDEPDLAGDDAERG